MKKLLFALLITFLFMAPVQAADNYVTDKYKDRFIGAGLWSLGPATEQGGWIQGMVTTKDYIYYWDASSLKQGKDGTKKTIFELKNLDSQLRPYNLDNNSSYFSFILSTIERKGNDTYVSGLIFKDTQKERLKARGKDIVGQTYTILFKVSKGQGTVMHVSLSKNHLGVSTTGVWDNATGMPGGAPTQYESRMLFNPIIHFDRVTPAKFSFYGDNVILTRHQEDADTGKEWADVIEVTAPYKATKLYTFNVNKDRKTFHYVYGVRNKTNLTIYDELGAATKHLASGRTSYEKLSDKPFLTRPQQRDGKMYFLNEKGFFNLYKDKNNKYHANYLILPEKIPQQPYIEITNYDWSTAKGGVLYLSDWLRPRDFWSLEPIN